MNADFIIFTLSPTVENFHRGCFPAPHQPFHQCSFNTLNKNLLQIKRTTRHEESEFLWKEPSHTCCISVLHDGSNLLPSPWSNFKLFTLVQYLNDLFSAAVSSTTLYHVALCTLFIKYQPGKTNPHFLALMSPDKTSCNSQIQSSNAWK